MMRGGKSSEKGECSNWVKCVSDEVEKGELLGVMCRRYSTKDADNNSLTSE